LATWLGHVRESAIDFFFPSHCVGCGKVGTFFCDSCYRALPRILPPICTKCGKPESTGALCPTCWGWQSQLDGIRSPFRFDGVIRQAIHELKYRNLRAIASHLAGLLYTYLQTSPVEGEILVPVPLYYKRLRYRGYNQSSLIARDLGKLTGLPVVEHCLNRLKDTPAQARTKTADERRRNVVDAFSCTGDHFAGKTILLIDDVCTSGATLEACAMALKLAGASSI
jgi:competence protein ComFC